MAETDISGKGEDGWQFGPFALDPHRRELTRDGATIALNTRYFDALVLLLEADGTVVSKSTFLERAWHGVPVTDEALTQAIRNLRKALGDDAASPDYIATIPKHGYRFIAGTAPLDRTAPQVAPDRGQWSFAASGLVGGAIAGILVGLLYGTFATGPGGGGALSAMIVMIAIAAGCAAIAARGIALGAHLANRWLSPGPWAVLAGTVLGGIVTGAAGRMLMLDGLGLLLGEAQLRVTGPLEGAAMGAAIGLGLLADRSGRNPYGPAIVAGVGGAALAMTLSRFEARFLAGSLDELGARFAGSKLNLDSLALVLGEAEFGATSHVVTGVFEAAVFCACVAAAISRLSRA